MWILTVLTRLGKLDRPARPNLEIPPLCTEENFVGFGVSSVDPLWQGNVYQLRTMEMVTA